MPRGRKDHDKRARTEDRQAENSQAQHDLQGDPDSQDGQQNWDRYEDDEPTGERDPRANDRDAKDEAANAKRRRARDSRNVVNKGVEADDGDAEAYRGGAGVTRRGPERSPGRQRDRGGTQMDRTHRNDHDGRRRDQPSSDEGRPEQRPRRRFSAVGVAEAGLRHLGELTSKEPIGVASIELSEDGWVVGVEVVEERRLPSSTDVLAVYEVQVDDSGDLVAFRRAKRYARCQVDPATVPDQQGPGDE